MTQKPIQYRRPNIHGLSAKALECYEGYDLEPIKSAMVDLESSIKFAIGQVDDMVDFCDENPPDNLRLPYDLMTIEGHSDADEFAILFKRTSDDLAKVFLFIRMNGEHLWKTSAGWVEISLQDTGGGFRICNHDEIERFAEAQETDAAEVVRCAKALAHRAWLLLNVLNTLLECRNIEAERVAPPNTSGLGKRKKKLLRFEYRVLVIGGDSQSAKGSGNASGSHRSPRFHMRRGHVRNLPNGAKTWVSSCAVGSDQSGVIAKDYRVKS
jgi:hypothetical protein